MTARRITAVVGIAALTLLAAFVWPSRYRYDHWKRGVHTYPVRIDRFTGRGEYFAGEWISDEPETPKVTPALSAADDPGGLIASYRAKQLADTLRADSLLQRRINERDSIRKAAARYSPDNPFVKSK
jgi:hypothetical protein